MRIIKLTLENFQGVKKAEYFFDKKNVNIFGDNATGKTTLFNAFTWVLFNRSSENAAGFSPKPIDGNEEVHNLDTAVEIEYTDCTGTTTLRKVYHEIWEKKRGSPNAKFIGHETKYFINGLLSREKEFKPFLETLGTTEQLKCLTSPEHFASVMKWQDRRALLVQVCGNITDADVIAKEPELAGLPQLKGSSSVEDFRKITQANMKKANEELKTLPERIDECRRSISTQTVDIKAVESEFSQLSIKQVTLQTKRARLTSGGAVAELQNKLYAKEGQLSERCMLFARKSQKSLESGYAEVQDLQRHLSRLCGELSELEREKVRKSDQLSNVKKKREEILAEYKKVIAETFDETDTVCRTCEQDLPQDKIVEMLTGFNERKSKRLTELNEKGKSEASKEFIADLEAQLAGTLENHINAEKAVDNITARIAELNANLETARNGQEKFENTAEYQQLIAEINAIREKMVNESTAQTGITAEIDKELAEINAKLDELSELKASTKFAEQQKARVTELQAQQTKLGDEYVRYERVLYFCELFVRTKMSMLDEKINRKFKSVKFRLFENNITNDGIKDCCDVLIPSPYDDYVEWSTANHAARINAGLEIIETLGEFWSKNFPVWIDNAESVTKFVDVDVQVVRLIVSKNDKKLRVEQE